MDCRFLPPGGPAQGVLSVYIDEHSCGCGAVAHDPQATLDTSSGEALYPHSARSLPPPDALSAEDDDGYMRLWQSNCPLYTAEAVAVLGGWHFPWPDGDWEELRTQTLLLWTIEDSEPWVEVWLDGQMIRVEERIT